MGVWIETNPNLAILDWLTVTPCMGVWIETRVINIILDIAVSHTLYGCVD